MGRAGRSLPPREGPQILTDSLAPQAATHSLDKFRLWNNLPASSSMLMAFASRSSLEKFWPLSHPARGNTGARELFIAADLGAGTLRGPPEAAWRHFFDPRQKKWAANLFHKMKNMYICTLFRLKSPRTRRKGRGNHPAPMPRW